MGLIWVLLIIQNNIFSFLLLLILHQPAIYISTLIFLFLNHMETLVLDYVEVVWFSKLFRAYAEAAKCTHVAAWIQLIV